VKLFYAQQYRAGITVW